MLDLCSQTCQFPPMIHEREQQGLIQAFEIHSVCTGVCVSVFMRLTSESVQCSDSVQCSLQQRTRMDHSQTANLELMSKVCAPDNTNTHLRTHAHTHVSLSFILHSVQPPSPGGSPGGSPDMSNLRPQSPDNDLERWLGLGEDLRVSALG